MSPLWLYDADDKATVAGAGEWYVGGVATGETSLVYTSDTAGDVEYRESITGAGATRMAISNSITVAAAPTVPAQMSAPTVTSTGTDSISVDLAAAPGDGGSAITSYDLRWQEGAGVWTTVTGKNDPETISGLTADTLYNVQTRAVNAVDPDPDNWSTSGSATTDAAAPANGFFENWTGAGYNLGTEVAALSNWAARADLTTGGATASLFDNGGTTMLRADTANSGMRGFEYAGVAAIGNNRRMTVDLARVGDVVFSNFALVMHLHFVDGADRISLLVGSDGMLSFRGAGTGTQNWDRTPGQTNGTLTNTSTLSIESNSSNEIIVKMDGVQEGPIRTMATPPVSWSVPMLQVGNQTTNTIIQSINLETLP